jgi:hypothetical protein
MQKHLIDLQLQRGRLLERIAYQREALAVQVQPVSRALHVGDRLTDWVYRCKLFALQHPLAVVAAVATVVVLRPTGVLRWTRRGFFAWRSWSAVRGALPGFLSRFL